MERRRGSLRSTAFEARSTIPEAKRGAGPSERNCGLAIIVPPSNRSPSAGSARCRRHECSVGSGTSAKAVQVSGQAHQHPRGTPSTSSCRTQPTSTSTRPSKVSSSASWCGRKAAIQCSRSTICVVACHVAGDGSLAAARSSSGRSITEAYRLVLPHAAQCRDLGICTRPASV